MAEILVSSLIENKILTSRKSEAALVVIRKNEKLGHLLEFSRAGHTNGQKLIGGVLYATTYPCHSCARHIIAAGISSVYYIEPYRKSLATKLHSDAITESEHDDSKVRILMYEGVAPRRYLPLFRLPEGVDRKEGGKMKRVHPKDAEPVISTTLESIPILESLTVKKLKDLNLV
ncbi:MAG: hypothetical protein GXO96_12445 [Nitrospirae bacterium]|nr:hypothetical protein [Candidatus Manganitrophaceae bacterium]